jgi:small subunit ribosomal protein S3
VASRWYANKDFPQLLKEDALLRKYLKARLGGAAISDIHIERKPGKVVVTIHTGRPGVVIGKKGAEVDKLRDELAQLTGKEVGINVEEIKRPELEAQLVADNIANQLAQRISFRRAMKRAVQSAMRMGAQGIKVKCGRAAWAVPKSRASRVPRGSGAAAHAARGHRLRDVDGEDHLWHHRVKVWIFKGEVVEDRRGKTYSTGRLRRLTDHMLSPKRVKFRKMFKGRTTGLAHRVAPPSPSARSACRRWSRAGSPTGRSKRAVSR